MGRRKFDAILVVTLKLVIFTRDLIFCHTCSLFENFLDSIELAAIDPLTVSTRNRVLRFLASRLIFCFYQTRGAQKKDALFSEIRSREGMIITNESNLSNYVHHRFVIQFPLRETKKNFRSC